MEVGIEQAESILKTGKPLIFPTDTVWGIGVAVSFAEGSAAIVAAKGRASDKPIAWLVGSPQALAAYGNDVPAYAEALAEAFWPGPLTLVVKASDNVPSSFRAAADTIGLRMPDSTLATQLTDAVGPIATTSANFAGAPATPSGESLDREFAQASQAAILACGEDPSRGGLASTVIDCTTSAPRLLRAGTISASEIEDVCGIPVSP